MDNKQNKKPFSLRELVARVALFIVGITLISAVCSLYLTSEIGNDCLSTLYQGISKTLGISYGASNLLLHALVLVVILIFRRSYIKLGTVVSIAVMPVVINLMTPVFSSFINAEIPFLIRFAICTAGCVVLCFGLALVIAANVGLTPYDTLPLMISAMIKKQYFFIRIALDLLALVIGFLLGGKVGLFTLVTLAAVGPLSQLFKPAANKITIFLIGSKFER